MWENTLLQIAIAASRRCKIESFHKDPILRACIIRKMVMSGRKWLTKLWTDVDDVQLLQTQLLVDAILSCTTTVLVEGLIVCFSNEARARFTCQLPTLKILGDG